MKKLGSITIESMYKTKDGRVFPVEITANYIKFDGKEYNCAFARDITERKFAERTEAVLLNIANATNTNRDLSELLQHIRVLLNEIIDTTNFYIALYDKNSDTISLPYMVDEKDEFKTFPAGKTLTSYVIRTQTPLLVTEKEIERMVQAGEIETIGTVSKVWLGVPLRIRNEVIGVVAVQSYTNPYLYTEKDLELLKFVSEQTAMGMEEDVKSQIFEPFFTTKETGKGTGLGLSMVYGIVKQSGGNIWVYSEPSQGTTFKIYFPRVMAETEETEQQQLMDEIPRGDEILLVVEDDDSVRELSVEILKMQDYKVHTACNGKEAYDLCRSMEKPVDLIITDVIMPQMGGIELYEHLNELWPGVKVIYMSGYAPTSIAHRKIFDPGKIYIQKPFNPKELAQTVREILDS